MKSAYKIKETKDAYKFSYTGNLAEALENAETELIKKQSDPNMQYWKWLKEKATKEIEANERAIQRIKAFISVAQRQLKESREGKAK